MKLTALFALLPIALFISIEPALADKSYEVIISSAAKVGSVQLQPGEYKLVLDDSSAHFTGCHLEATDHIGKTNHADAQIGSAPGCRSSSRRRPCPGAAARVISLPPI